MSRRASNLFEGRLELVRADSMREKAMQRREGDLEPEGVRGSAPLYARHWTLKSAVDRMRTRMTSSARPISKP
jgi:hypothetical protein